MASALKAASAKAMEETLSELAGRIGIRLAGSTAERQAAERRLSAIRTAS